jgi:hypothetical protein
LLWQGAIYFIVSLMRGLWLDLPFNNLYLAVAIAATMISVAIGVTAFHWILRNLDASGY